MWVINEIFIVSKKIISVIFSLLFLLSVLFFIWCFLVATTISSFHIPTDSMQPTLKPGDNILVNKWIMGARIFDIWKVAEGKETKIHRLPGIASA